MFYIYGNVWYVSVYRKCWYRPPKECSWSASCGCLLVITFSNSRPAAPFVQIFPHPLQNLLIIILLCPTQYKPSRTYYIRRNITHVYERATLKIHKGKSENGACDFYSMLKVEWGMFDLPEKQHMYTIVVTYLVCCADWVVGINSAFSFVPGKWLRLCTVWVCELLAYCGKGLALVTLKSLQV